MSNTAIEEGVGEGGSGAKESGHVSARRLCSNHDGLFSQTQLQFILPINSYRCAKVLVQELSL